MFFLWKGRALTRQQGILPACDCMVLSRVAVNTGPVSASFLLSSPAISINLYLVKSLLLIRLKSRSSLRYLQFHKEFASPDVITIAGRQRSLMTACVSMLQTIRFRFAIHCLVEIPLFGGDTLEMSCAISCCFGPIVILGVSTPRVSAWRKSSVL